MELNTRRGGSRSFAQREPERRYHESSRPELRILSDDPAGLKSIDNGGTARVTAILPIGRFGQR